MATRSEPGPLSLVVVTVNVAARAWTVSNTKAKKMIPLRSFMVFQSNLPLASCSSVHECEVPLCDCNHELLLRIAQKLRSFRSLVDESPERDHAVGG